MDAPYAESAARVLESCQNDLLATISQKEGWEEIGITDEVARFQLLSPDGKQLIRAIGIINFSCDQIADFIWDHTNKKSWDGMLGENRVVHDFGNKFIVMYERFGAPWPVSHRDFVYAAKLFPREDGLLIVAKSIDAGVPEVGGVVRGDVFISGFYLKRLDESSTQVTYLVSVDLKGSLPGFIVGKLGRAQSLNVNKIRHVMEKRRVR